MTRTLSRRRLLSTAALGAAVSLLAACGSTTTATISTTSDTTNAAASSTSAGAAATSSGAAATNATSSTATSSAGSTTAGTTSSAAGSTSTASAAAASSTTAASSATTGAQSQAAASVAQVPRNQSLIMSLSDTVNQFTDVELMNPFMTGVLRNGWQFAFEPLYFYDMWHTDQTCGPANVPCKDGEIPWQAESYSYNPDFSEVTIALRNGVTWSDGQPFTADDVVFTLTMLKDNAPKLTYSVEMKQWVQNVTAVDPRTVKVTLTGPNPRFMFDYFQWHSDLGVPILPKHIFQGKDPTTFTNFDLSKGWPVVTGPWKLTLSSAQQRFWDRRDDWWGASTGFHPLPKMQRVTVLPNYSDEKQLELLSSNEIDCSHGFQTVYNVPAALKSNPKLEAWTTGNAPPYGALDISTVTTLDFNDSKPPFDDPDIRWAINHTLNRDQIVQIGSHGIGAKTVLPFPRYGALQPYYDGVADLLKTNPIDAFDLAKSAQIMQSKGYAKDSAGLWAKGGQRFAIVLIAPPPFFTDITPVIVQQLRKGGFDAAFKAPTNSPQIIQQGDVDAFLDVPGGSVRDPYVTLSFLLSRYSAPTGTPAVRPYRWKNDAYDKIVQQLGTTGPTDPKFMDLYHQAMALWIPNLPMIPLINRYIYITPNTTYWTNWPNQQTPYTLPSSWHRTAGLYINTLTPAGG